MGADTPAARSAEATAGGSGRSPKRWSAAAAEAEAGGAQANGPPDRRAEDAAATTERACCGSTRHDATSGRTEATSHRAAIFVIKTAKGSRVEDLADEMNI